jgi:hypothetical protein
MASTYIPEEEPNDSGGPHNSGISTIISNQGREPIVVRITYEGYDKTHLISPGQAIYFPVRIPRESVTVIGGNVSPDEIKIIYDPAEYRDIDLLYSTVSGVLCRRGRFRIPGYLGREQS